MINTNIIKDETFREDIETILSKLPDYFYEIPASSSGKYHPKYTLGEGGLLRHTKAAVKIAYDLLQLDMFNIFDDFQKDLILGSLMIHDGLKYGYDYDITSYFKHPLYMAEFVTELLMKKELKSSDEKIVLLAHTVSTHMGQWNTNKYSVDVLPLPNNDVDRFVHMCDYLASRKYLEVPFDEEGNIIE